MMSKLEEPPRLPLPTRYSLLSRLRDWGDERSWRDFFETYSPLIYHLALKSGLNEAEAQDVVQETVVAVAKDIDKFRRERELGSFKGWLRNLVRWRIGDQLRGRGTRVRAAPLEQTEGDLAAEPAWEQTLLEENWEKEWQQNLLSAAIAKVKLEVKEEHFQIFDLVALQGVAVADVTRRLGVGRAAIYLIRHRISKAIKKHVQQLEKRPI